MGKIPGEWYAEWDEEAGGYCVFHTDLYEGKAFYSFGSLREAEEKAEEWNRQQAEQNKNRE